MQYNQMNQMNGGYQQELLNQQMQQQNMFGELKIILQCDCDFCRKFENKN